MVLDKFLGLPVSHWFSFNLFRKRTFGDKWHRFLTGPSSDWTNNVKVLRKIQLITSCSRKCLVPLQRKYTYYGAMVTHRTCLTASRCSRITRTTRGCLTFVKSTTWMWPEVTPTTATDAKGLAPSDVAWKHPPSSSCYIHSSAWQSVSGQLLTSDLHTQTGFWLAISIQSLA